MNLRASTVSRTIKQSIKEGIIIPRLLTSNLRPLPTFIIIGAQKSGTTSLYDYMVQHPQIVSAVWKGANFFDFKYYKGLTWYRSHFPIIRNKGHTKDSQIKGLITGEASPEYIFHPQVPSRVHTCIPKVKLIAILRNPVDRSYSQYYHRLRNGFESLPFEEAIEREKREKESLESELKKMLENDKYQNFHHYFGHSYLARGRYVDQLKLWASYFPKEQMLILKSEDLFKDPSSVLQHIWQFLNLPAWELDQYEVRNPGSYSGTRMNTSTREHLINYFKPHNQRLYDFLGVDFGWDQ